MKRMVIALVTALPPVIASFNTNAQTYPVKPVTIVVASVAGGANDTGARLAAPKLAEVLGKLLPIAVTAARRSPLLPDVPTVGETYPGFEAQGWIGLLAPAATPRPVVERLREAMVKVLAVPEIKAKYEALGYEVAASTPEEFGAWVQTETSKWGRVIRERKITID